MPPILKKPHAAATKTAHAGSMSPQDNCPGQRTTGRGTSPATCTEKRVIDIVLASLLLGISAPALLFIAGAIKLTSPGPVLFRQERLTLGERRFHILKFRTMVDQAETQTGPTWVGQNDARITPVGQFLRKTHLDEFPQLWNVIIGEMSLIGPRPERPFFVAQFKQQQIPDYPLRHTVRAGIAGYAQLLYPNPSIDDIALKTQADIFYVQHWSPWLDLKILWKTGLYFLNSLISH